MELTPGTPVSIEAPGSALSGRIGRVTRFATLGSVVVALVNSPLSLGFAASELRVMGPAEEQRRFGKMVAR